MFQQSVSHKICHMAGVALVLISAFHIDEVIAADPERCEGFGDLRSISLTTWESGNVDPWVFGTRETAADFNTPDWTVLGSLPDNRSGQAAFVEDIDDWWNCDGDIDGSGVLTLESPLIKIPADINVLRLSIDHWFATEAESLGAWDGGNLKIRVNSGEYLLIPASAIEVNPYNLTLFPSDQYPFSTNPLAGEQVYSGPILSWWQSHINLLGIAAADDDIQLRFEFGIDSCGGDIGWYVDDVEFYSCSAEVPPSDTSLTLVKKVINNNGGSESASDWTLSASGPSSFSDPGPIVSSGPGFIAGTYNLSESGPTGYLASNWVCDFGTQNGNAITIAPGQVVTCTITNNDIQPTLTVVKTIINDNGGTITDPDAFGLKINGSSVADSASNALNAGNYTVSEDGLAGYQPSSWGGNCNTNGTITLVPGQNATCTITNNDISPTITVFKSIINDNGGKVKDPNAFGLKVDNISVQHSVSNPFNVGNHKVSEDGLPDYKPGKWGGDCNPDGTITLALEQNATCTITNDDIDPNEIIFKNGFE